jgi:hypothetical protein
MRREEVFDAWAPPGRPWSPWVKPVLFASLPHIVEAAPLFDPVEVGWAVSAAEGTALLLDLPGDEAVRIGATLAQAGRWRPVPLYNAHPGPDSAGVAGSGPLVDMRPIVTALIAAAPLLRSAPLTAAAPPAFLLDSRRRTGEGPLSPGRYDNRSVTFVTDLPSANLLLSRGITSALLVQHGGPAPQADLAHALRRWNAAGVHLSRLDLDAPARGSIACPLRPPSRLALWWFSLTAAIGLRRHPLGGFGGTIPDLSAGG